MGSETSTYADALEWLPQLAGMDWLELSAVFDEASGVLGKGASALDIVTTAMSLATDLTRAGFPPGDLQVAGFVPWPGPDDARLARLRRELLAAAEQGVLPIGPGICWFSSPD